MSEEFRETTGALINIRNEIMSATELPPGKGGFGLMKELLGSKSYPGYVNNQDMVEEVWELSRKVTKISV
jgi:hypothetical protein